MKYLTAFVISVAVILISILSIANTGSSDFKLTKITDNIFSVTNPEGGENQLVITSEKGLVVLNSFWSEITAQKFKKEIIKALNRDDIIYNLNIVDRLDLFGGNAAYSKATIIGHQTFIDKYKGKEDEVNSEIKRLIDMWRWKEDVSRERLKTHEPGSEKEKRELKWLHTCKQRANELEAGFSLILPEMTYNDRMILNLGDITLNLIWFGKAGYDGLTVISVPDQKLAIIPGFILHSQHLAPHPQSKYAKLDVPRWIKIFEELLEGENAVDKLICDNDGVWSKERAITHLNYIRKLWKNVKTAEAVGKTLDDIQDLFSLDKKFSFVKEMLVYKDGGDGWIRPQHKTHVRLFFLQHKNLASEFINKEMKKSSLKTALEKVIQLPTNKKNIYFDEASINGLGYYFLSSDKIPDAIEIFKLNVEVFPESANAYDSLGEGYMKNGEKELAIQNYTKSLELNPDNTNAKNMLKSISENKNE
jgi:hypothetical protein